MIKHLLWVLGLLVAISPPICSQVLFEDAFGRTVIGDEWKIVDDAPYVGGPSAWGIAGGVLVQRSNIWRSDDEYAYWQGTHIVAGSLQWSDYEFSAILNSGGDDDGMGMIIRYQDPGNYYRFIMLQDPGNRGPFRRLEKFVNGIRYELDSLPEGYVPGRDYAIAFRAVGDLIQVLMDGEIILQAVDRTHPHGQFGFHCYAQEGFRAHSVQVQAITSEEIQGLDGIINGPRVMSTTGSSAVIRWQTQESMPGTLQYARVIPGEDPQFLTAVGAPGVRHEVSIEDLQPASEYLVQVIAGSQMREVRFRTAPLILERGPYLGNARPGSLVVRWEASASAPGSMTFWPQGQEEAATTIEVLPRFNQGSYQYHAELEGLVPGAWYSYIVSVKSDRREIKSRPATFMAPLAQPDQPLNFLVYGDTQHGGKHLEVVTEMLKTPNVAFVLHTGDLVNSGSSDSDWASFFNNGSSLLASAPFYPTLGNHDDNPERYLGYFDLPDPGLYYAMTYGPILAISLNTNIDYSPRSAQYKWFEEILAASEHPWKIVFFHHPPYSPTPEDNTIPVRRYLNPLFEKYGVCLVLSGHSHVYDHCFVDGVHYVISGGGGGYLLTYETSQYNAPFHFLRISVTPSKLVLTAVRPGGEIVHTFNIAK